MKKLILSIFGFIICFTLIAQQSVVVISGASFVAPVTFDNTRPRIVLSSSNSPVVLWGNESTGKVYTAKYTGTTFSSPHLITPGAMQAYVAFWNNAEMAASGDTVFVAFKAEPSNTGGVFVVRSVDGGSTWGDTVQVDQLGSDRSRFASVAIAPGGNPVVHFMRFGPTWLDPHYVVAQSADGGATFAYDIPASTSAPGEVCDCCPATMAIRDLRQVLFFRNNNSDNRVIWAAQSLNAGQSFPNSAEIDLSNWTLSVCPSSGPDGYLSGDSLYYTWMSAGSGQYKSYIGSAHINSMQLGANRIISGGPSSQNFPRIAGNGDTLAVVWEQSVPGNKAILMAWSVTGVAGIGSNIDTIATGVSVVRNSDIEYANGKFHIVYQDEATNTVIYKTATVTTATSVNEPLSVHVKIYPVPSSDYLMLENLYGYESLVIFDNLGREVLVSRIDDDKLQLDVAHLATGVYSLKLTGSNQTLTNKFVKK